MKEQVCLMSCLLTLTGCFSVSVPLTPTVTGYTIKPEHLEWVRPNETTRQEIVDNWGPPTFELRDERLLGYAWTIDKSASWELWRIGADPVIKEGHWGGVSRHSALFAYDPRGRILKVQVIPVPESTTLEQAARDWLKGLTPPGER
jgi:hypothetical protein